MKKYKGLASKLHRRYRLGLRNFFPEDRRSIHRPGPDASDAESENCDRTPRKERRFLSIKYDNYDVDLK